MTTDTTTDETILESVDYPEPSMPDVIPAQALGGGVVFSLLISAIAVDSEPVQIAAVVVGGVVATATVVADAVVRWSRNRRVSHVQSAAIRANAK